MNRFLVALTALVMLAGAMPADAQAYRHHHRHWHHHHHRWHHRRYYGGVWHYW